MRPAARMTPKLSLTWLSQIIFCEKGSVESTHNGTDQPLPLLTLPRGYAQDGHRADWESGMALSPRNTAECLSWELPV